MNNSTSKSFVISNKTQAMKKWSFWNIYINYGLDGSLYNLWIFNPICTILTIIETVIEGLLAYAIQFVIKTISIEVNKQIRQAQQEVDTQPNYPGQEELEQNELYNTMYFVLMMLMVIFSDTLMEKLKILFRPKSNNYKFNVMRKIFKAVSDPIKNASPDILSNYDSSTHFEAMCRFIWVYDETMQTLMTMSIQFARSLVFCLYMIYVEYRLVVIIGVSYFVTWKFIIPYLNREDKNSNKVLLGSDHWDMAYYELNEERNIYNNPIYSNIAVFDSNAKFIEILEYYNKRNFKVTVTNNYIEMVEKIILFTIIMVLYLLSRYETMIIVIINRNSLFGIIQAYCSMKNIEQQSSRSLEKIVKILEDIDNDKIKNQTFYNNNSKNFPNKIEEININKIDIVIKNPNKTSETDQDNDNNNDNDLDERIITISNIGIKMKSNKVLLLRGITGCGKSTVINKLAGTDSLIENSIFVKSQQCDFILPDITTDFNRLRNRRVYVSQFLADDYITNGSIKLSLKLLFPLAQSIDQVRDFLIEGFKIKPMSIPNNLDDAPHSKLCGGERQRYIIASQIWKILMVNPDFVLFDEIDKALDEATAVHMMQWILNKINTFAIIITHAPAVEKMLFDKKFISQVWNFEEINNNNILIKNQNF